MIALDALVVTIAGLDQAEVEHWIDQDWLRPTASQGTWLFAEIDVARLHLIRELRYDLGLRENGMSVVLRLLDQLYDERRRLRLLRTALEAIVLPEAHRAILQALLNRSEE